MTTERKSLGEWRDQCLHVVNLIHGALKTIENAVTQDSDEMAAAEVLRIASKGADDLYGEVAEAVRVAEVAEKSAGDDGAIKTETTLDKLTQQASNTASLVHAAKIIAEGLELGDAGDELALTEVLRRAETAANELFGESHAAAETGLEALGLCGKRVR